MVVRLSIMFRAGPGLPASDCRAIMAAKGGNLMFCPFIQDECRSDCIFYDAAYRSLKTQCSIFMASCAVRANTDTLAGIASDTSFIPGFTDILDVD